MRAATAPTRQDITAAARAARWQKFLDMVPPEITDPAERTRRAELLRLAFMKKMSLKAAAVNRKAAEARRAQQELAELGELLGEEPPAETA
jgi:hypothetical protein